jgi:hypothetical protein
LIPSQLEEKAETAGLLEYLSLADLHEDGTKLDDLTRLDLAKLAAAFCNLDLTKVSTETTYSDCGSLTAQEQAVINAVTEANLVDGYSDGTFRPDDMVPLSEVAEFLCRCLGDNLPDEELCAGVSLGNIRDDWCVEYIDDLYKLNIIPKDEENTALDATINASLETVLTWFLNATNPKATTATHQWGSTTVAADGVATHTCTVCGDTATDEAKTIPADLTFKEINESYYTHFTFRDDRTPLFSIQSAEYAISGDYAYFRIRFQDDEVTKFLVRPMNTGYDETADGEWINLKSWADYNAVWTADKLETNVSNYGEILILDADAESGVFTCKVPMSWFENYGELIIAPSDGDGIWREYIPFKTAYFLNDLESLTYQKADYRDDSYEVADCKLMAAEYAEVPGGRMYRITYTNTEPIKLNIFLRKGDGKDTGDGDGDYNAPLFYSRQQQAGDNVSYYFVSNPTLEEYDYIQVLFFLPDADSPDIGILLYLS